MYSNKPSKKDIALFKKATSAPYKFASVAYWDASIMASNSNSKPSVTSETAENPTKDHTTTPITENTAEHTEGHVTTTTAPTTTTTTTTVASSAAPPADDDEVDLFGSDEEEDAEAERLKQQRLAEYAAKKAAKGPKPAAKSIVTLDVKPWDDETNLEEMEKAVRAIKKDGLVWGASKFVAVGFGIKKLQINSVVEDEKISIDDLQAEIEEDEDHVQSTDVAAMQKL